MQNALPLRTQRIGCSRIVGLYGGKGGGAFTELPDHCNAVVSKIFIRAAAQVDAIQLTYQYSNGNQYAGGYHGGTGGTVHRITLAGSLVHMEDPEEHCLQFTAAKSEESMDILRSFFTTLDFFVTMWTDVASYM